MRDEQVRGKAGQDELSAFGKMTRGFVVLGGVSVVGVLGYLLKGWSILDSIYMVVITIFGVGYGEVRSLSDPGTKIFTIFLIISGCSALIYILGAFFQMLAEGELNRALGKMRMTKQINQLENHVIVCGYGRIGRVLAKRLQTAGVDLVVIDQDTQRAERAVSDGYPAMVGDASHDASLRQAGIARARSLCSVLPSDAMNVFITLTARNLNANVHIIARGEDPETEPKLRQAGANQVVLPSSASAHRMADMITRPAVLDYLRDADRAGLDSDLEGLGLKMVRLPLTATAEGKTVADLEKAAQVSLMVVALVRGTGETIERPALSLPLFDADEVLLLVHAEHAENLKVGFAKPVRKLTYRGATLDH